MAIRVVDTLSFEGSKNEIKKDDGKKALHEYLDKKISDIPNTQQQELAKTPEGTVVLLYALAQETNADTQITKEDFAKISGGDRDALLKCFTDLQSKVESSGGDLKLDPGTQDLLGKHIAVLKQFIDNKDSTLSIAAEGEETAVLDIAATNTSTDFRGFLSKLTASKAFRFTNGGINTPKDLERFQMVMRALQSAVESGKDGAQKVEKDGAQKVDFRQLGYKSERWWANIMPGINSIPKAEREALGDMLKGLKDLVVADQAVIKYLGQMKTPDEINKFLIGLVDDRALVNGERTTNFASLKTNDRGQLSDGNDDLLSESELLANLDGQGGLDNKLNNIVSEVALATAIDTAQRYHGLSVSDVYRNVTGNVMREMNTEANIARNRVEFINALRLQMEAVQTFFGDGVNNGLQAIISGKGDAFVKALEAKMNKGESIKIPKSFLAQSADHPVTQFLTKYILPVGTLAATSGAEFATFKYDKLDASQDAYDAIDTKSRTDKMVASIKKYTPDIVETGLSEAFKLLGNGLQKLDQWATVVDTSDKNYETLYKRIGEATKDIQGLKDADITAGVGKYAQEIKLIKAIKADATPEQIKRALLANAINNIALGHQGGEFNFKLSLAYLAVGGNRVKTEYKARDAEGKSQDAERVATTEKNMDASKITTDITMVGNGGKLDVTIPTTISINGIDGKIPVTSVDGKTDWSGTVSFEKSGLKVPVINIHTTADGKMSVAVTFRPVTDGEKTTLLPTETPDLTDEELHTIQTNVVALARTMSNADIRKDSFHPVLKDIMDFLQNPTTKEALGELMKKPKISELVPQQHREPASLQAGITILESIIAGLSGDWRYRGARSLIEKLSVDGATLNKEEEKYARELLLHMKDKNGAWNRESVVKNLSRDQLIAVFKDMDMGTIQNTLTIEENKGNETYTANIMTELGVANYDDVKKSYETSLRDKKVAELSTQSINGIGFEMSHMVRGAKYQEFFKGVKPTTGESQMIGAVDPQKVDMPDAAKFINQLTPVQLSLYESALTKAGLLTDTQTDIKTALNDPKVTKEFFYAQSPNCTNAIVFMRIKINGQEITPLSVDVAVSQGIADQVNTTIDGKLGVTPKVAENDKTTEQQNKGAVDSNAVAEHNANNASGPVITGPSTTIVESTDAVGDIGALL